MGLGLCQWLRGEALSLRAADTLSECPVSLLSPADAKSRAHSADACAGDASGLSTKVEMATAWWLERLEW
eukprot:scaffold11649_cov126-Isochrysis_galbana.AAC.2